MADLIIPFICFLYLAGLIWLWFDATENRMQWQGTIDELDRILSNLMTANLPESCLTISVPGHLTSVMMNFRKSVVRLKISLVTDLRQNQRNSFLGILQNLDLNVQISDHDSNHETLVCEVDGPSTNALPIIKNVFANLIETDSTNSLN